jgi:hypothetical protein
VKSRLSECLSLYRSSPHCNPRRDNPTRRARPYRARQRRRSTPPIFHSVQGATNASGPTDNRHRQAEIRICQQAPLSPTVCPFHVVSLSPADTGAFGQAGGGRKSVYLWPQLPRPMSCNGRAGPVKKVIRVTRATCAAPAPWYKAAKRPRHSAKATVRVWWQLRVQLVSGKGLRTTPTQGSRKPGVCFMSGPAQETTFQTASARARSPKPNSCRV